MFFNKRKVKRILIAGSPKSGTTALFYKILKSSPDKLLSFFEPKDLSTILKKRKSSITKIVVTGEPDLNLIEKFSHVILIQRDPRDILISSMLYEAGYHNLWNKSEAEINSAISLLQKKEAEPKRISVKYLWENITYPSLSLDHFKQRLLYLDQLKEISNKVGFPYKNIINENYNMISEYLGFQVHAQLAVDEKHKRVVRSKSFDNWRKWFTKEDAEYFSNFLQKSFFSDGMEKDWELNDHEISPTESSSYVLNLINDRKPKN